MLKIIAALFLSVFMAGCSTHFETTNQVNDSAFLQLEGNFLDTQLTLDGGTPITLNADSIETFSLRGKKVTRFPVSTGKHTIKVTRSGTVVVNRVIYVSNSNTFEVVVP